VQSHSLFAIAKLLVIFYLEHFDAGLGFEPIILGQSLNKLAIAWIFTVWPHCSQCRVSLIAIAFPLSRSGVLSRGMKMQSSVSGSTILLVSGEVKFIRTFAGDHPQRGR